MTESSSRRPNWSSPRALAAIALLALVTGCIRGRYVRVSVGEPLADELLEPLRIGESNLGDCLALLGAPTDVFRTESGAAIAMAWLWADEAGFRVRAAYSFLGGRFSPAASIEFRNLLADYQAIVLVVDHDLTLRAIRRGFLRDIVRNPVAAGLTTIGNPIDP